MNIKLTDDFTGVEWNGAEKTYSMEKLVNVLICEMRKQWPDFGLTGSMAAQGEGVEDRWTLEIGDDGFARRVDLPLTGTIVTCPHCKARFEHPRMGETEEA